MGRILGGHWQILPKFGSVGRAKPSRRPGQATMEAGLDSAAKCTSGLQLGRAPRDKHLSWRREKAAGVFTARLTDR